MAFVTFWTSRDPRDEARPARSRLVFGVRTISIVFTFKSDWDQRSSVGEEGQRRHFVGLVLAARAVEWKILYAIISHVRPTNNRKSILSDHFTSDIKKYTPTLCRYGNIAMVTLSWYMISLSCENERSKFFNGQCNFHVNIWPAHNNRTLKISQIRTWNLKLALKARQF